MDIKFDKDAGDSQQPGVVEEKGKQSVLLVVLLILAVVFGYIYFFTGLIKPTQEQKVAEAPSVSPVVKKPLPSADGKPAKAGVGEGEEAKKEAAPPVKPEPVKALPAAAPVVAAKPVTQEAAKPKEEVKKNEASQAAVKKPLPVAAKAGDDKPAQVDKKPAAAAEKKPVSTKEGEKKVADVKKPVEKSGTTAASSQPKKEVQKSSKKEPGVVAADSGRWTVLVGNYVLEEALATDLARVRKAGLEAYVVPSVQKKTHMNRLLLAEFTDRASAQAELDKLKRHTSDAFMIDSAGMHIVYAGSYLLDARALSEKERLTAAGFSLTVKRADVAIPTKNLTAGSFPEKNAADDIMKKLRAAGVKATLTR